MICAKGAVLYVLLCFRKRRWTWGDIDVVLLVGGSTRMPMIQEMITEISGKAINPQEVNPDDVVALGCSHPGHPSPDRRTPDRRTGERHF